jgi:hypothetical protein
MRNKLLILILLLAGVWLDAQMVSDPNDRLYTYITLWEEKGWITQVPPLRPYPLQVVKPLLKEVIAKGESADRKIAQEYLDIFDTRQGFRLGLSNTTRVGNEGGYESLHITLVMKGEYNPLASYALNAGTFIDTNFTWALPRYTRPDIDYLYDWSYFDINNVRFNVGQSFFGSVALGNEKAFFQTGLVRNSYGPFYENGAILGSQAPHAGHFSFTYRADNFTLDFLLLALIASDDFGNGRYPQKYLSMHAAHWYPFPWLEIGAFEVVVYGDKFNPVYLVPLVELFYAQSLYGVYDNSLFGFTGNFKLPENVTIKSQIFIDDLHFNDLISFDFDTKYKVSLQAGVNWTPLKPVFKRLAFDYLLVTPYMYTHLPYGGYLTGEPNYLNYTHNGVSLGSVLEPNSDQFSLSAFLTPVPWLETEVFTRWIRHGNASLGYSDQNVTGTIFDAGYKVSGDAVFQETTRFLTQDVLEHVFQLGLDNSVTFNLPKVFITISLGYTFEVVLNEGLIPQKNAVHNYGKLGAQFSF